MIDYQQILADDPGGPISSALVVLKQMVIPRDKSEYFINERTVYAALGAQNAEVFLQTLEGVAQSADPLALVVARVVTWLKPSSEAAGVDICNVETQGLLQQMGAVGILDQSIVDSLIALSVEKVLKYPNIKYGDIEKARAQA
jgi:hypothetical protein